MNWLEVSLAVNGELAEAVADVLARFAPNGVTTEQSIRYVNQEDEGTADGPVTVRAYLPVDEHLESTRRKIEESLHYLRMIQHLPAPAFTPIAEQNWMDAWKQHYRPIRVGRRLIIVPSWLESPDRQRVPIRIEPGMAFGTGTHPSTQLCLALIEKVFDVRRSRKKNLDQSTPMTVIDVGCGSGILSIAALKLGAATALGVDIDPQSIQNARQNAAINGIGSELVLGAGSVAEIILGKFEVTTAMLVMANILAPVIVRLFAAGLADLVAPGGAIILGGILQEQMAGVLDAAQAWGLHVVETQVAGDWAAFLMSRSSAA
jgi:ribosomal protein L11 methyltransferase